MHRWPCRLIRSREPSRSRSASPRRSTSTRSFTGPRVRSTKSPRVLPEPTPRPCPLPGSLTDSHHVRYFGRQLPDAVNSRCRPKCAGREWQVSGKPTGYWASYPRTSGDSRCLKVASRQKSGTKLNGSVGDIAICTQLRRKGVNRRRQLTRYLGKTASKIDQSFFMKYQETPCVRLHSGGQSCAPVAGQRWTPVHRHMSAGRITSQIPTWVLVHLRTIALRRPQTRVRSLSSVTGNSLKQGICASRPVGPLSASDPSRAQNFQMHQNPRCQLPKSPACDIACCSLR